MPHEHERRPGEHGVFAGEQQFHEAVRVADPGQRIPGDDGVRPVSLLDRQAYHVQDLGHDERVHGGEDRERPGAQPVQREDGEEGQPVEGEDHVDFGVEGGQGEPQGDQGDGTDDHPGHRLPSAAPGTRVRAAGDEDEGESGEQCEQRGGTAPRQLHDEAQRPAYCGVRADMGGVHAEDREPTGQIDAHQPPGRGPTGECGGAARFGRGGRDGGGRRGGARHGGGRVGRIGRQVR